MRVVVGHSEDTDAREAAAEAIERAERALHGAQPVAGLVYASIDQDHATLLAGFRARWPGLPLIGCTTDGECSTSGCFSEDSVVLVLLTGEGVQARTSVGRGLAAAADAAVRRAVDGLGAGRPPKLVVALSESMDVSGATVVASLVRHLPPETVLVGGTAGDRWKFQRTQQFFGDEVVSDAVTLLAIDGELEVSVGVESGWRPMGRRARVTRASGSVLQELDGRPALEHFQGWFGAHTLPSPEHPLAVFEEGATESYLRAPFPRSMPGGAILLAGDVPEGAMVQVTEAGRDQILEGARQAMRRAVEEFRGREPSGLLLFSCAARKQVLGTRTHQEIEALTGLGPSTLTAGGFYTYGEIGPSRRGSPARFHNETVVAALVGR